MTDRKALQEALGRDERIWDVFTNREEYAPSERDAYGRFTSAFSRRRNIDRPVASIYLKEEGFDAEYPEGHPFAICLTHDVDDIRPTMAHRASHTVHSLKERVGGGGRAPQNRFSRCDYRNFQEIMRLEEEYGATSSFFFLTTDRDFRRFRYYIEDLEADMGCIRDQNHEVGLHGGYGTYCDQKAMAAEKARLERVLNSAIVGYRSHYIQFETPDTWHFLHQAGFEYDTTYGYPDVIGFRNGMCHPYWPFDRNIGQYIDILEIPLCIMDVQLPAQVPAETWRAVTGMVDAVEACHGTLTLNFHNDTFSNAAKRRRLQVYQKILELGKQKNAWMTSGEEIYHWWMRHGY